MTTMSGLVTCDQSDEDEDIEGVIRTETVRRDSAGLCGMKPTVRMNCLSFLNY